MTETGNSGASGGGWLEVQLPPKGKGGATVITVGGRWIMATAAPLSRELGRTRLPSQGAVTIDGSKLAALDSVGALLLSRLAGRVEENGETPRWQGFPPEYDEFITAIRALDYPPEGFPTPKESKLVELGRGAHDFVKVGRDALAFFGLVVSTFLRLAVRPWKIRWTSVVHHMNLTGLNAMPIVGLLTFLIGIVLTFLSANQLARFGAQIFVADLIGIALLRELGVLITAILVAGRSGSAFTAQLGSMQVNEEVDALQAMGLDPVEVLTVPRILALVFSLPLLAFFATMMGIFGGMLIASLTLDIGFIQFIDRVRESVQPRHFFIGIAKAPVFAFIIAMIGCFEGFNVSGNAESVGRYTTRSVVESIFLVIVCDAVFAMVFFVLKM